MMLLLKTAIHFLRDLKIPTTGVIGSSFPRRGLKENEGSLQSTTLDPTLKLEGDEDSRSVLV